jgi:hypothetical protein
VFTSGELSQGVNLALLETPIVWQAMSLRWASGEKNTVHQEWMRVLVRAQKDPDFLETAKRLQALETAVAHNREQTRQPKERRFVIVSE